MNSYNFIEKLGSIGTKVSKCRLTYTPLNYPSHVDELKSKTEYKETLQNQLRVFRLEIQQLPFTLPTRQGRRVYLNNLYDELILQRLSLTAEFKQAIAESNKCISSNSTMISQYFPKLIQKKYLTMARKAHQRFYFAYELQKNAIGNCIAILQSCALNDGIEIKTLESQANSRVVTDLSSPELSYIFYVLLEKISIDNKFNRKNFSKIIASNFSTKMASAPQANQIRKHFTQVDASVKSRVGNFF
ncbi:hypothetical protein [Carboxylicivirga marina]|uniref:hypothetical protein n=1 Tax=Carboxylicivirga marina TaxID=2800988 RepID=UPI002597FB1E|nr:hypothetical protein [uncultured Carboxylicivirga sp.]